MKKSTSRKCCVRIRKAQFEHDLVALDQKTKTPKSIFVHPTSRTIGLGNGGDGYRGGHVTHAPRLFVYKSQYSPQIANVLLVAIVSLVHGHSLLPGRTDLSWPVPAMPYPFSNDTKHTETCDGTPRTRQLFWKLHHYTPRGLPYRIQQWWMTSGVVTRKFPVVGRLRRKLATVNKNKQNKTIPIFATGLLLFTRFVLNLLFLFDPLQVLSNYVRVRVYMQ